MQFGARRRPSRRKLLVEALENRRLMATLQGNIFVDSNINGIREGGENLLVGRQVTAYVDLDASGTLTPSDLQTPTTDGTYVISSESLGPGTYNVRIDTTSVPFSPGISAEVTVLDPLQIVTVRDIGIYRLGEIRGLKFNDHNADGIRQSLDEGMAGVDFTLTNLGADGQVGGGDDGPAVSIPTDTNGNFVFSNLVRGTYQLTEAADPTLKTTTNPFTNFVINASGQVFLPATATLSDPFQVSQVVRPELTRGNFRLGEIYGYTFVDVNGNGIDNNDPTVTPGVTVSLRGAGPDNAFGTADDLTPVNKIPDVVTGRFDFKNLDFGRYQVLATLPTGVIRTTSALGVYSINDSGLIYAPTDSFVDSGERQQAPLVRNELAIGLFRTAVIRGNKFNDHNADGSKQSTDEGVAGVLFSLTNLGNNSTVVVPSAANGDFIFPDLVPGTYRLSEEANADIKTTTAAFTDFVVNASGQLFVPTAATVAPDTYQTVALRPELRRGNFRLGEIYGYTFVDVNGNAVDDAESRVTPGVTLTLRGAGPDNQFGTIDDLLPQTIAVSGAFEFKRLDFGRYQIAVTLPTSVIQTTAPLSGVFSINDSGLIYAPTTTFVSAGARQQTPVARPELAIGVFRLGVIAGYAFGDRNGDGVDTDNSEPRGDNILNVPAGSPELRVFVQLRNAVTNVLVEGPKSTGADGQYSFVNLLAGTYTVEVVNLTPLQSVDGQPSRVFTTPTTIASLLVQSGSLYQPYATFITLTDSYQSSILRPTLAIGSANQAAVRGMVFLDRNGDGVRGAAGTEPGMATFVVSILSSGPDNIFGNGNDVALPDKEVTTDATGLFDFDLFPHYQNANSFTNVTQPGSFRITVTLPDHYRRSNNQPTSFDLTNVRLNDVILGTGLNPQATVNEDQTVKRNASLDVGVERFAAIHGVAFNDLDADGVKDAGEVVLANQTFQIVGTSATFTPRQVATDSAGLYFYDDLPADTYTISPLLKTTTASGVVQETQGRTKNYAVIFAALNNIYVAPGLDPRLNFEKASSSAPPVERILLNTTNGLEQGIVQLSKLEGNIFIDGNVNGKRDATEAGHVGVQVGIRRVLKDYQQDEMPIERIVSTDSTGKYTFYVWPGTYDVAEVKLSSFEPTAVLPVAPNDPIADASRQRFTDYGLINPNSGISTTNKISKPRWTTAAALDGDGKENDLIVVYEYFNLSNLAEGGGVTIYKNVGTTNELTITESFGASTRPSFATVVNLDNDPAPEILVTLSGTGGTSAEFTWGSIVVLDPNAAVSDYAQYDAKTGLAPAGNVPIAVSAALAGDGPKHISSAVIDGRVYLSVVNERTFSGANTQDVSIVRQASAGSLQFVKVTSLNLSTSFVEANVNTTAFGNFDNQPGAEIAVAQSALGKVEFFTPTGVKKMSALTGLSNPTHVLAGNFVGPDATDDLVVSEYGSGNGPSRVSLYPQLNGTISPSTRITTQTLSKPGFLAAADINNDGLLDLAITSLGDSGVQLLYNRLPGIPAPGSTKFQATTPLTVLDTVAPPLGPRRASVQQVAFGSFNNDSSKDFAATQFTGGVSLHTSAVTSATHWKVQTSVTSSNKGIALTDKRQLPEQPIAGTTTVFPLTMALKNANTAYPLTSERPNTGAIVVGAGFAISGTFTTARVFDAGNIRTAPQPLTLSTELAPGLVAFDVSGNGQLEPLDALLVINALNRSTSGQPAVVEVDVNADGVLSPLDALLIINQLNLDSAFGQTIDVSIAQAMYDSALTRLGAAPVIQSQLSQVTVTLDDLPEGVLSWVDGNNLVVDRNAGGRGWFVDTTPMDDVEFATDRAVSGVDLLTVLTHELGHLLGLEDLEGEHDEIMHATVRSGQRRLNADAVDRMLANLI